MPPTPAGGSYYCESAGGNGINIDIQATDIDPLETVTLSAAIAPGLTTPMPPPYSNGGFAFKNTLPAAIITAMTNQSATANSTTAAINWTVSNADWGIYQVEYTSENSALKESKLQHSYIIDRAPYFVTSVPSAPVDVIAGQAF